MSATTTTTTAAAPVVGDNKPTVTAFATSAIDAIGNMGKRVQDAERAAEGGYQTVAAIILALAERDSYLEFKTDAGKAISADLTKAALIACDGDNRTAKNSVYGALSALVQDKLGCELGNAQNVVLFAARLASLGYTLNDFNGKVREVDGKLVLELPEYAEGMPQYTWPGLFRMKPSHIANTSTQKYYADATLAYERTITINGKVTTTPDVSPVQEVCITDRRIPFFVGAVKADGSRETISVRPGRKTFLAVTTAMREAEAAQRLKDAAATVTNKAEDAEKEASDKREEASTKEAAKPDAKGNTNPTATTGTPATGTPATAAPQANGTAGGGTLASAQAANGNGNQRAAGAQEGRNDEAKREEAWTPAKVAEHSSVLFEVARIKNDVATRQAAVRLFAMLAGRLKAAGFGDVVANPIDDATVKNAMRYDVQPKPTGKAATVTVTSKQGRK